MTAAIDPETQESRERMREAFWLAATGLLEWQAPPLERDTSKLTHYGRDEYVDPFDVDADWEERS